METLDNLVRTFVDFAQNQPIKALIASGILIVLVPIAVRFVQVAAVLVGVALLVLTAYFYFGGSL